ncbi:MAG: hypothetical protein ACRDPY_00935 [Streptosporangiaceae bacterium]
MITAVLVAGAFMAGIMIGFIAFLRAGIAREESDRSLLVDPTTSASAATRRIVGLYVRTPRYVAPANHVSQVNAATDREDVANCTWSGGWAVH